MNKKFLSAILFGALMVTSTGTFVSCKDYDDDIKDLQTQINSNKDAIAALQKLVGEGNWVTGVTSIANGFTVTMSNGQTTTITGINGADGADGKDGVEWTIGEDGFWYKDGEKTDHQAVAEDGKPGVTAPSPSISADGKWVVYEWDATKGEFVAKTTEIPAQGTSAYVVKKDGVYVLHIADETGAFQDVTLPATSDSFVVEAPYSNVEVKCAQGVWKPSTTSANYKALLKKFPEIGNIAKNTKISQSGELPVLVTPANADLADGFTFGLQTLKGMTENVTVSKATKGLSSDWNISSGKMSRAASTDDCFWTLQVDPVLVNNAYKNVDGTAALVAENAKGTVVKTAFAYTVIVSSEKDVDILRTSATATYAPSVDLFASDEANNGQKLIEFNDVYYRGYYIIELADQLKVEQYDLSIAEDGHTLVIGNMPANLTTLDVKLNVTVLGLNGSTDKEEVTVTVQQEFGATGALSDKLDVVLSTKKIGNNYAQNLKWNISELGFNATQTNAFLKAAPEFAITYIDENGDEQTAQSKVTMLAWNAAGNAINITADGAYQNVAEIGFQLNSSWLVPGDYTLTLEAKDGNATIFKSESNLTVANPKAEDLFSLATAYTADGKVLQAVGSVNTTNNTITYDLRSGVVKPTDPALADYATTKASFVDADKAAWDESDGSATWGKVNWVNGNNIVVATEGTQTDEGKNHLNKERNITANFKLFNNAKNVIEYNFKVKVMSPVYTADASNITVDATKLAGEFGYTGMQNDPNIVDMTKAISAKYAVGKNYGKPLYLFSVGATIPKVPNEADPKMVGDYVLGTDGNRVAIKLADLEALVVVAGDDENNTKKKAIIKALADKEALGLYLTRDGENNLIEGSNTYSIKGWADILAGKDNEPLKTVYNNYKGSISFNTKDGAAQGGVSQSDEVKNGVKFEFVNEAEANKYLAYATTEVIENGEKKIVQTKTDLSKGKLVAKDESEITENPVDGKAVIAIKMTVKDIYGMTMTKTFDVTISIHQ